MINHHLIREKLTNNDAFKIPPSEEIVNYQIIKKLNNFKVCKKTEFLFILKNDIDVKFIQNLKEFFSDSNFQILYHLLIEENKKKEKFRKMFNTIQIIDANWQ